MLLGNLTGSVQNMEQKKCKHCVITFRDCVPLYRGLNSKADRTSISATKNPHYL
jgi:hypothetical protein